MTREDHEDQVQNQPMLGADYDGNEGEEVEPRVESLRAQFPTPSISHTILPSRQRGRSRMVRLALVATALVVLVAVVIGMFVQTTGDIAGGSNPISGVVRSVLHVTPNPTATPTRVPYPTPTLGQETSPTLGQAPTSCAPSAPVPRTLPATLPGAIGGSPVWVVGFEGSHATKYLNGFTHTRYGWKTAITFAIESDFTDPVVMRGERLSDGTPLWFQVSEPCQTQTTPSVAVVLDPQQPGLASFQNTSMGLSDTWAAWDAMLYLPDAGCYALNAKWPGGSWRVTFIAS